MVLSGAPADGGTAGERPGSDPTLTVSRGACQQNLGRTECRGSRLRACMAAENIRGTSGWQEDLVETRQRLATWRAGATRTGCRERRLATRHRLAMLGEKDAQSLKVLEKESLALGFDRGFVTATAAWR
jgi:hypothetical protein